MILKILKIGIWKYLMLSLHFNIPEKFIKKALQAKVEITPEEIMELYLSIDKRSGFLTAYSDAIKNGVNLNFEGAKQIYAIRKTDKIKFPTFYGFIKGFFASKGKASTFSTLLGFLVKTKKKEVKFSADELKTLYKEDRNLKEITAALLKAKEDGVELNSKEIKTLFYGNKEQNDLLNFLIQSKEETLKIGTNELRTLYLNNINIKKLIHVKQMLKKANLDLSFPALIPLLDDDVNIIACIKILKATKAVCIKKLKIFPFLDQVACNTLANEYVIYGKSAFKKKLSAIILEKNILEDPALLYQFLVKAKDDSFKIHLSLIIDFVKYSYNADINEVVKAYLTARKNGRYAKFKHLAKLAEREINTASLIDAQINSGAVE